MSPKGPPPLAAGALMLAVCVAPARSAIASAEDLFGYGPASQAMGMTGTAAGSGFETVYTNPALLCLSHERKLSLGFTGAHYALYADGPLAPGDMHIQSVRGIVIGATLPMGFGGVLRDRLTLGVGFFTPTDVVVRGRVLYPETPQFGVLGERAQSVALQLGLGANLGHGLRAGGGFAALAAIAGKVLVATNESGQVGTKVDDQLIATYGPILGVSYDLGPDYRVGATYRGVLDARFAVEIVVRDLGSLEVPPFNIAGIAQYDPRQIQLEAARVTGPWRAAIALTWRDWSAYPGPPEPTVLCPSDKPDCAALRPPPFNFHDTFSPRLGVEHVRDAASGVALHLRGGYAFEPSPAPQQSRESNFYDNSRHVLTAGYGLHLSDPLPPITLDLFTQLHLLLPRTHTKDADIPADHPGAPSTKTHGSIVVGGLVLGVAI
jgi:long-subunit fatty acid transport protein